MFDDMYPLFQDLLLLVRGLLAQRRLSTRPEPKMWQKELEKSNYEEHGLFLYSYEKSLNAITMIALDVVLRERLFILTIANKCSELTSVSQINIFCKMLQICFLLLWSSYNLQRRR